MTNFLVGELISCLNTAQRLHVENIHIKFTRFNLQILIILKEIGIIRNIIFTNNVNYLNVFLKRINNQTVFKNLILMSKPGKRNYISLIELKKLKENDTAIYLLSTNKGLKIDIDCLILKLSGEVILKIEL